MKKTKENKSDLGNKTISTVFDIVYQRSLMIPKESFEILKKRNEDVDLGEDDGNVITFIDDKENPLIFAYVWFGKVRYCAKDYYEICRVRYAFRNKCLPENLNKEKYDNFVNDLEFGVFSQLSEMVKDGLNQDIEKCYIRDQINGSAIAVKIGKNESYVKCLSALTSVCSANQVTEDMDNLFDINYLKRHPECGSKLCKKCNARLVHNNDICAFCKIEDGQIDLGSQNEEGKILEMAVDFVEEQLAEMGDTISDSNPALDVTPNIFVLHGGEPCGVLVRSKEDASPLKLSLRNRFDMINMSYETGYKPLLAPVEIVHNDGTGENEYTFSMGKLEVINNDIVPDKKTKEYAIYVILKLLESYWRKNASLIEPFLSKHLSLKSMFREERLDIHSKEKVLEYYKQFFEEYKNCKFAGWLIRYVGNLGNPFMAYGTYKGGLEPSRTFVSQPGGTIGLLLGQQFEDPNKNMGTAFTVEFDGDGLISGIEMYPPEILKYEPFIE